MLTTQTQWPNWAKIKRKEAIIHIELVGQMSRINWNAGFFVLLVCLFFFTFVEGIFFS